MAGERRTRAPKLRAPFVASFSLALALSWVGLPIPPIAVGLGPPRLT